MINLCTICNFRKIEKRQLYCNTCYVRLLKSGEIAKLPKPILPSQFTSIQDEIIIGSMLGDGCIFKYKNTHKPYFCIIRSQVDEDYLNWEYSIFKDFCASAPKYKDVFDKRTNKIYHSIKMMTRRMDLFESYYQNWYPNGVKIVPKDLELSPLSIAIWICDDGNISFSNVPYRMRIKLSTHGFVKNDVDFLYEMLKDRYDEKFSIIQDDGNFFISGCDNATRAILNEVDLIFPDVMSRKMYWRKPEACFYDNQPKRSATWK